MTCVQRVCVRHRPARNTLNFDTGALTHSSQRSARNHLRPEDFLHNLLLATHISITESDNKKTRSRSTCLDAQLLKRPKSASQRLFTGLGIFARTRVGKKF